MKAFKVFLIICLLCSMANLMAGDPGIKPRLESAQPGLNADDPAIWIHPTDKSRSLFAGLDKSSGLAIFNMKGEIIQQINPFGKINNVDTSYNFILGGKKVDIFVTNIRKAKYTRDVGKAVVMVINPNYSKKVDPVTVLSNGKSENVLITPDSYGLGLYKSPKSGKTYMFDAGKGPGPVNQWEIKDDGTGKGVVVTKVRSLNYPGGTWEGCVVDDEAGHVYIPEEGKGIYKYYAEPDASSDSFFFFDSEVFLRDREGSTLYKLNDGTGYYIVSNQGDASQNVGPSFTIFTREKENKFVKQVFYVDFNGRSGLIETDGLDVSSVGIPQYPNGFLIAHNSGGSDFLLYDWKDIANDGKVKLDIKPEMGVRE